MCLNHVSVGLPTTPLTLTKLNLIPCGIWLAHHPNFKVNKVIYVLVKLTICKLFLTFHANFLDTISTVFQRKFFGSSVFQEQVRLWRCLENWQVHYLVSRLTKWGNQSFRLINRDYRFERNLWAQIVSSSLFECLSFVNCIAIQLFAAIVFWQ